MKQKIMEVLLNTPSNLTKEEIMWAASNLPDDNKPGSYDAPIHYDHSQEDVFVAIGTNEATAEIVADKLSEVTKRFVKEKDYKVSHALEDSMNKFKEIPAALPIVTSILIRHVLRSIQEREFPAFLMEMLRKHKGGGDQED